MRAIFEVTFKKSDMCDEKTIKDYYGGSWEKCVKHLYKEDGMGIFMQEPRFIGLKEERPT